MGHKRSAGWKTCVWSAHPPWPRPVRTFFLFVLHLFLHLHTCVYFLCIDEAKKMWHWHSIFRWTVGSITPFGVRLNCLTSNIFNKTVVPGQQTHYALLSTWSGWNREMYVPARSLVGSGLYIRPHVLDWKKRGQSKKMLNNAENWVSMWALRGYPFACVVKCIDMHGGRHSEDLAGVGPYFLLGSHQNMDVRSHKSQKSKERHSIKSQRQRHSYLSSWFGSKPLFLTYRI